MRRRMALLVAVGAVAGLLAEAAPASATPCAGLQAALTAAPAGSTVTLDGGATCTNMSFTLPSRSITLQGDGNSTLDGNGPGTPILTGNDVGTTTIRNLTFKNASLSNAAGPAIRLTGNSAPTITGDTFLANTITGVCCGGTGGAVSISTTAPTSASVIISQSRFGGPGTGNTATNVGGGVYIQGDAQVALSRNEFRENTGLAGGGIAISQQAPRAELSGNLFAANRSQFSGGGAYLFGCCLGTGALRVTSNIFNGNRVTLTGAFATGQGGGLLVSGDGTSPLTQTGNVFDSNSMLAATTPFHGTASGAGEWLAGVPATVTGDRFVNNDLPTSTQAGQEGAGAGFEGCGTSPTGGQVPVVLTDAVLAGNRAGSQTAGVGLYVGGCARGPVTLTLNDSTIAGNSGPGQALWGNGGDTLTAANSIVKGAGGNPDLGGFFSQNVTFSDVCLGGGAVPGPGNICADPKLVAPGPGSADIHQTAQSPTIDAGSNALVPSGLTIDESGFVTCPPFVGCFPPLSNARILAGHAGGPAIVDMGASEAPAGLVAAVQCPGCSPPAINVKPPPGSTPVVRAFLSAVGRFISFNSRGVGFLTVTCSAPANDLCSLTGSLFADAATARTGVARRRPKGVKLGSVSGTVPGGRSGRVKVTLTRAGSTRVGKGKPVRAKLVAVVSHRGAGSSRVQAKLTLSKGSPKKKR